MKTSFNLERLRELLGIFRSLNPEMAGLYEPELFELAQAGGPEAFEIILQSASEIVGLYLQSPVKRAEQAILKEYYSFLDKTTKRMIEAGELPRQVAGESGGTSLALVPEHYYSSLQWLQLKTAADVPQDIVKAVDAARRHNLVVESVLEILFTLLLKLDRERSFAWQLELCRDQERPTDPDIARDLIRAWRRETELPAEALKQILFWSEDETALRHWPAVIQEADRVLRKQSLLAWAKSSEPRLRQTIRLKSLAPFDNDDKLLRWLKNSVSQMGESIDFFCDQRELLAGDEAAGDDDSWRQDAMFRELIWLVRMMPPMLLLADLLLSLPTGPCEFAMAVFGFTSDYRRQWEKRLVTQCQNAVRRCFLRDLRRGRTPLETIHILSFGDSDFERNLISELDLLTQDFDSIAQREIVVDRLAHMYAGFREANLLAQEIGRRYRRMMRVLHEDNLRRVLKDEQFAQTEDMRQSLTDLSVVAAESRRFLSMRRALERNTEEIVAADMDFSQNIRRLRAGHIHRLLGL